MANKSTASDKTTHNSKLPGHCEAYVPTPQKRLAALLLEDIDVLQNFGNMSLTSSPVMLEVPAKRRKLRLGQSEVCRERDPCEPVAADTQERPRNLISPEICYGSVRRAEKSSLSSVWTKQLSSLTKSPSSRQMIRIAITTLAFFHGTGPIS